MNIISDDQYHQSNQRKQRNQSHHADVLAATKVGAGEGAVQDTAEQEPDDPTRQASRNHCPHHPREHLVRFDPAGQAWCDRLDCWDCYWLMRIHSRKMLRKQVHITQMKMLLNE